ncbi:hypothetical protein CHLRE_04g215952v5 [Chlamydomonas reinhardtii]|uniref:Uncharacterized protein n=1 Tax=Chlamydomonas reinhardtii TaxID=3055 RepID=A0A2K3DTP2_CHLRE|nr:uncharacterized protein CHLRE_04g215952v5 [Chlamydomonas reinhardtii]PNW83909.1 hypothetical protein CHLRE_04g215952v5 [Chlamydomonas reinhardtii]
MISSPEPPVPRSPMAGLAARAKLPSARVLSIGLAVVADFWGRLQTFVTVGIRPKGLAKGWDTVPSAHPFISRAVGEGVVLRLPYAADSPPPSP